MDVDDILLQNDLTVSLVTLFYLPCY